jgi:hypothetical protein
MHHLSIATYQTTPRLGCLTHNHLFTLNLFWAQLSSSSKSCLGSFTQLSQSYGSSVRLDGPRCLHSQLECHLAWSFILDLLTMSWSQGSKQAKLAAASPHKALLRYVTMATAFLLVKESKSQYLPRVTE